MNPRDDDLDSTAILRRAHYTGIPVQTYDPNLLTCEIQDLLRARGLQPDLPYGSGRAGIAQGATGTLLRAFGILPAGGPTTIDRPNAPDAEDR
jgi:hypothetical protein